MVTSLADTDEHMMKHHSYAGATWTTARFAL